MFVAGGERLKARDGMEAPMAAGEPLGTFTDLYEFTMAQSLLEHGRTGEAVFDLHVRDLPPGRGYLVACGAQTLAERLEAFTFDDEDLAHLAEQGLSEELLAYLEGFSFEGRVRAIPEGRLVFPYEPLAQIEAPLPMAQIVETLVLNTIHLETVLASKAARCFTALDHAPGEGPAVVDFGARRAHGLDAARAAARASYVAGLAGTSLVQAARELSIPCFGTMAHSYV
jgi:nicotinate phosphoribosyltransferase